MRVLDLTNAEEREAVFEPRIAEVFGIRGRSEVRHYSAIDAGTQVFANVNPCDYCALGTKVVKNRAPLCSYARITCKAEERTDGRRVIFRIW